MRTELQKDIAVLVLSFDGFSELWQPFFDRFFNAWPGCPYKIYLLTNEKTYNDDRVSSLRVGPDVSWSDNLSTALRRIPEKYVLFFYEDAFLTRIDHELLNASIQYCLDNDLDSLLLRPSLFRGKSRVSPFVDMINREALYRNSLFVNLMKREVLLAILSPGENAWQYEIIGNNRSKRFDFYSVTRKVFAYDHGIVKGKWLLPAFRTLQDAGYRFDKLHHTMSFSEQLRYSIKLWLFNQYIRFTPLRLLLRIEHLRSPQVSKYL